MPTNEQKKKQVQDANEKYLAARSQNSAQSMQRSPTSSNPMYDKALDALRKTQSAQSPSMTNSPDGTYAESDTVRQAKDALSSLQKPGEYQSPWQKNLDDIINRIQNREKFSYDLNGDALYQQYKDQYMTQGQMAMMDTMGQASALTGGYGSSYAQGVGQQAYQGYLQGLNDKVPELYQLALNQYNREGEELYNQYGLIADRENTDYGRYRDTVSDYNTERGYLTDQYNNERNFDYGQHIDDRNYAYQVARDAVADDQWNQSFDYQKDRDAVADQQWQASFDEEARQFDTTTALTREEMAIQQKQWQAEFDETVRQADRNYELNVKQIEEDIRHNKITEAQGLQQLKLAQSQLEEEKRQADLDYAYKMASLTQKSNPNNKPDNGNDDDTPDNNNDGDNSGFTGTTYEEAVAYMKKNGVVGAAAAGIMTRSEFASRRDYKANFDGYEDYLRYIVQYNIENRQA